MNKKLSLNIVNCRFLSQNMQNDPKIVNWIDGSVFVPFWYHIITSTDFSWPSLVHTVLADTFFNYFLKQNVRSKNKKFRKNPKKLTELLIVKWSRFFLGILIFHFIVFKLHAYVQKPPKTGFWGTLRTRQHMHAQG